MGPLSVPAPFPLFWEHGWKGAYECKPYSRMKGKIYLRRYPRHHISNKNLCRKRRPGEPRLCPLPRGRGACLGGGPAETFRRALDMSF